MNPLLSIIVPVYKVEKYLRKCLESIFSQNADPSIYEVILVNDGTPDNSMEIAEEFASINANLRILNQENQGLSMARNNGMKIASGEYFWFVDSDDTIVPGSIQRLFDIIEDKKTDVIAILAQRESEADGSVSKDAQSHYLAGKEIVSGSDYLFDEGFESPAQLFVMRSSFLKENDLAFYPGILHEDIQFCLRMLYLANTVYLLHENIYNYLIRSNGSITSNFSIRNCNSYLILAKTLFDFRDKFVDKDRYDYYTATIVKFLLSPFYAAKSNPDLIKSAEYKKFTEEYKTYINDNLSSLFKSKRFHKVYIKIYFQLKFFYNYFSAGNL